MNLKNKICLYLETDGSIDIYSLLIDSKFHKSKLSFINTESKNVTKRSLRKDFVFMTAC